MSANGQENVKIVNVFFRTNFPLYGIQNYNQIQWDLC